MKLIRYEGENVTPSDDAILYRTFLSDGLFATVTPTFTSGAITIPAMRGVICGRDFTTDIEELTAVLASSGTINGQIYMWIDMEDETYPLSIKIRNSVGSLSDDDINNGGQYYGLEIAQYTANTSAVTGITLTVGLVEFNGLADKAPLASPEFTDIPKAPTAPVGTSTTQLATTAFVSEAISVSELTGLTSSYINMSNIKIKKTGKLVTIYGRGNAIADIVTDSMLTLFTLTEGWRPDITVEVISFQANINNMVKTTYNTNGVVTIYVYGSTKLQAAYTFDLGVSFYVA